VRDSNGNAVSHAATHTAPLPLAPPGPALPLAAAVRPPLTCHICTSSDGMKPVSSALNMDRNMLGALQYLPGEGRWRGGLRLGFQPKSCRRASLKRGARRGRGRPRCTAPSNTARLRAAVTAHASLPGASRVPVAGGRGECTAGARGVSDRSRAGAHSGWQQALAFWSSGKGQPPPPPLHLQGRLVERRAAEGCAGQEGGGAKGRLDGRQGAVHGRGDTQAGVPDPRGRPAASIPTVVELGHRRADERHGQQHDEHDKRRHQEAADHALLQGRAGRGQGPEGRD
jgi:hypothetical protein